MIFFKHNNFLWNILPFLIVFSFASPSWATPTLFNKKILPSHRQTSATELFFVGNNFYSAADLKKSAESEINSLGADVPELSIIDDAAFQMEMAYRNAGFPKAIVRYNISEENGKYRVYFLINEGQRLLVKSVSFSGNSAFTDQILLAQNPDLASLTVLGTSTPYVEYRLKTFINNLAEFYRSEGFLDITIGKHELTFDQEAQNFVHVLIPLQEGERYRIGDVVFDGNLLPETHTKLASLADSLKGNVYHPRLKLLLHSNILELYKNQGYADIKATISAEKIAQQARMNLLATVDPGPKTMISEINISGNERTQESYIRKQLRLEEGQIYSLKAEKETFAALYQNGLFDKVSLKLQPGDTAGEKALLVDVKEKPAKTFFVEPGWGSYELFRLTTGFSDRNLFGTGKALRVEGSVSGKQRLLTTGYTDPRLLNSSIKADIPITYRLRKEPEYTLEESGITFSLSKQLPKNARLGGTYAYQSKSITDIDTTLDPIFSDNNYINGSVAINLNRDTRNDFFLPNKGYRGYAALEFADELLGGNLAYIRLTTGVRHFQKIGEHYTLALRYATGVILPLQGQENIPLGERFFNGGENSVRSFREARLGPKDETGASLGGTAYNTLNIELRRRLDEHLAGSVFLDAGNVAPNKTSYGGRSPLAAGRQNLIDATWKDYFRDFRYGVGIGLQYLLPIGPARLDFGFNPDRRESTENSYAIHFSVGMAF